MKKAFLVIIAFTFIANAIIISCNTPSRKVENAQETVKEVNNDLERANKEYLTDIENYRAETAKTIAENDKRIAEFNGRMAHDKNTARADYRKRMDDLKQKNREMKRRLDDYKADGKDKWLIFKAEFNHDMKKMGQAFKDLTVKNVK